MQFCRAMKLSAVTMTALVTMLGLVNGAVAAEKAVAAVAPVEKNAVAQITSTVCAACHGADGNSVITLNPKLAGQHPEYLVKQLTEFKSGKRANAVMSGMAAMLSDEDMKNVGVKSMKPLYAKPQFIGLSEDEILSISANCAASHQHMDIQFARAIEGRLKEKNL
jgi:cytochrome c553